MLGYFNRIPAKIGEGDQAKHVGSIRLVSSARNKQLDLTIQLPAQKDDATETESQNAEKYVNGFSVATANAKFEATDASGVDDAHIVYEIDLAGWFPDAVQKNADGGADTWKDGAIDADGLLKAENWVNAISAVNSAPTLVEGAVFAGEFTIPFNRVAGKNTFELQLLGFENGGSKEILKSWKVKLDVASQIGDDNADIYSIYRNHLYQIGKRGGTDDPNNPGTDPDKPQPLDKDQDLTIRINDQWEFIHDMEIE